MAVKEDEQLDEKTIACLEDAKKGKPRRFALVCKGAKVVSLVVYKKGSLDKYKKEAKEGGQGQFFHGLIEGKGANLNFKLARADGFDKAPGPTQGLKQFLAEKADLKVMPVYEIVDEIGLVLDADDPLTARFLKLQDAALAACDAHPDRAAEINDLCLEIGKLLSQDEVKPAQAKIETLEGLLKKLGPATTGEAAAAPAKPPPAPPPPPSAEKPPAAPTPPAAEKPPAAPPPPSSEKPPAAPPPPPPAGRLPEFMEKLKQLKPKLEEAKAAASASPDALAKVADAAAQAKQAGGLAQKGQFDEAFKLLDAAAGLVAEAVSIAGDLEAKCGELRKTVFPQVKPAVTAAPSLKDELVSLLNEASAQEKSRAFAAAIAAYEQLQTKVNQALAGQVGGVSVMKLGKARIEWITTREDAIKSMETLKGKLAAAYAQEPDMKAEVAAALKRLDAVFTKLNPTLHEQLDEVLKEADPGKRAALANIAKKMMTDFTTFVESDTVMLSLDHNEYASDIVITAPLRAKLKEIAAALG